MAKEKKNKFRETPILESTFVEEPENSDVEEKLVVKEKKQKKRTKKQETSDQENNESSISALKSRLHSIKNLLQLEQTQKLFGLILVLLAVFLFMSVISYFFTGEIDHDKVTLPYSDFFSTEVKVSNWLGKFGALSAFLLVYKGFGIASVLFIPVLLLIGVERILQKKIIKYKSFYAKWLFLLVWSSLLLSYLFYEKNNAIGGSYGYYINDSISNFIGRTGLIILLGFSLVGFLVLVFNIQFDKLFSDIQKGIDEDAEEPTSEVEVETPIVQEDDVVAESTNVESSQEKLELNILEEIKEEEQVEAVNDILLNTEAETIPEMKDQEGEADFEIKKNLEPDAIEEYNKAEALVEEFGEYDPTLDLGSYKFPGFDLLNDYGSGQSKVNQEELVANKDRIIVTLKNYGIEIEKIMATVGPTVTLYEIVPAAGVRISKIKNLEDDIALSLAALGIRIIAPIPGKGTIGIEVPNQTPEMVPMKNILASEKFNNTDFELPIALGKTISNEIFIADLTKMPHMLMAGATGQGKSVGLNAILVSLLYKKHPAQIKFVLVDPKKVELTLFNKIERHFLAKLPNSEDAIITDNTKVIHTLNSLCIEMDNRYALLQDAQVRNIKEYNTKFKNRRLNPEHGHKYLPYIVLVVDEFADLIMTAGKEVETPIARLAQLARAVGIHLIIATQRPSVNIITGTIKANFPARIAFRVTSKIDSRTILDTGGAEQLIGRGDMLLSTGNDLIRIQCAFVDTPEVEKITEFIGGQRAFPTAFMLPEYVGEDESGIGEVDLSERDKMFDDAAKLVVQFQQGSASFLQRKLKLGYNRAGRIVDQLEAAGVIGPFEGSKAREVLIKDMTQLDEILEKLRN
ncbi:MAG: DNA translocase FtsK 4TM domain-containing protein [Bacteroidia bacterium]